MAELVGAKGKIVAMDLAPENVAQIAERVRDGKLPGKLNASVGSLVSLPFENDAFDCVWSANVTQYLTEEEFGCAIEEMKRVLKPSGLLAIKECDNSTMYFIPMDLNVSSRLMSARRAKASAAGKLSAGSGPSMPSPLRRADLTDIRRKSWFVERWAPLDTASRSFATNVLTFFAGVADQFDIPATDIQVWHEALANPDRLINDSDFCLRESFVVAAGRVSK